MNSSIESREFVRLRSDQFAMAAHEAARHITGTFLDGAAPTTLREAQADEADNTRRKKCLCCGQWRQIRLMMHVCEPCHEQLEGER